MSSLKIHFLNERYWPEPPEEVGDVEIEEGRVYGEGSVDFMIVDNPYNPDFSWKNLFSRAEFGDLNAFLILGGLDQDHSSYGDWLDERGVEKEEKFAAEGDVVLYMDGLRAEKKEEVVSILEYYDEILEEGLNSVYEHFE